MQRRIEAARLRRREPRRLAAIPDPDAHVRLGLIEAIPDATIEADVQPGRPFGITGNVNRNGNDGTITCHGWKAQNEALLIFSGEAYNVEQGNTNELFPDER